MISIRIQKRYRVQFEEQWSFSHSLLIFSPFLKYGPVGMHMDITPSDSRPVIEIEMVFNPKARNIKRWDAEKTNQ